MESAKREGYRTILWSWHQDTEDWNRPGTDRIIRKVLTNARNGDIILFHDHVEGKSQTIAALKEILPELSRRGYRFVTVSELLRHKESTPAGR
ncbi:Bifunctional xylanase/deacetylase precursor [compost metagenome]